MGIAGLTLTWDVLKRTCGTGTAKDRKRLTLTWDVLKLSCAAIAQGSYA